MTEVTLIRHGQAQTGAKDEKSYDRLSDLGHEQAAWLGEYIQQSLPFDLVISGALTRQIETVQSMKLNQIPHRIDDRLNELDYFGLSKSLHNSHGVPFPEDPVSFAAHVPQILGVWQQGKIDPGLETYDSFHHRIVGALKDAVRQDGRVLLATSTGVIATLAAISLGLDAGSKGKLFLSVAHTSIHKFELRGDELHLIQFGATPHLDRPDRAHARSLI